MTKKIDVVELNETELEQAQGAGLPINFAKDSLAMEGVEVGIAAPSDQDLVTPKGTNGIIAGASA